MYKHLKEKLTIGKLEGKEKAVYENCLRFCADKFFTPLNCTLEYNSFGISVIPDIYNPNDHSKVILKRYINGDKMSQSELLVHQVYLHDLVMYKWLREKEGFNVNFEIECIRKTKDIVKL